MRSYLLVTSLILLLISCAGSVLIVSERVVAQTPPTPAPTPSAIPPQETSSSQAPAAVSPVLQCQACHESGKKLPYLGGALFHTAPHRDYDQGFHAKAISDGRNGGAKAATCLDCHTKNGDLSTMLPADNPQSTINRVNIAATCGKCHGNKAVMQGSGISNRPFLSYAESVHAQALARGNASAAVCIDCHNSHDIRPASDQQSSIFKINIPKTCGQCHRTEANEFVNSVHGLAVARGVSRSPVCTDCHGIHDIQAAFDPATAAVVATDSCAKCHEGVTLTREFGVASGRVASYKDSYHGLASQLGSKTVANCASCHGVHNILPSSDPKSMINAQNLPQTCGQCHVGASANFTSGKIHLTEPSVSEVAASRDLGLIGTRIVRWIYLPLIFIVIGGMVVHNAVIWRSKAVAKRKREGRSLVRLTRNQRVQHWLLLSSFIVLVISGFALQYPDSWLAWLLGSSEYLRRGIHRVAAVVMLAAGVYHVAYLGFTSEGRQWTRDMLPRLKDVRDVVQNFTYYLGLNRRKPKIARFGYAEKAEYWAVLWGTIIMGLTGLMIWFKLGFFSFLSRGWIEIALAIHFYEAVLATLAIVVWHFYHVIFDPDVYPINWAFLDGRISEELYKEEHELDYERLEQSKLETTEKGIEEGPEERTVPASGN